MSKLERLLKLLAILLHTPVPLSADVIRSKLEAYPDSDKSFHRAFERDKDDLRSMGVNLLVGPSPGTEPPIDGYRVDADEYAGRDPGLEPDELAALHLAAALVRLDSVGEDAFWKLGGAGALVDSPPAVVTVPTSAEATELYSAIAERRVAVFGYRGERRELEPSRLSFTRGHWYVSGVDRLRAAERVFRLDRIENDIELGPENDFVPVEARGPELIRTWELGDGDPIVARVAIDAEEAIWAQVHLRSDEIVETGADGSVIVELRVSNLDAFRDWLLGFLENAVIVEPESLRHDVTEWLGAMR